MKALDISRDKELIITQTLNKGNCQALKWLGKTYSRREIKNIVSSPPAGMWLRSVLLYWLKIFNLNLDKKTINQAILDLNPR